MTRCTTTVQLQYIRNIKCFYRKTRQRTVSEKKLHVGISHYMKWASLLQTHNQDYNTCNSLPYVYDLKGSKAISCCYHNNIWSFLYEYFEEYVYLNYAFSPSSGVLVITTTIQLLGTYDKRQNFVKYPTPVLSVDMLFLPRQGIWYNKATDLPSWQCLFLSCITNSKTPSTGKFGATKILTGSNFVYLVTAL